MPEKGMEIEQAMFSDIFVVCSKKKKKFVTVITSTSVYSNTKHLRYIFTEFSLRSPPPGFNINP